MREQYKMSYVVFTLAAATVAIGCGAATSCVGNDCSGGTTPITVPADAPAQIAAGTPSAPHQFQARRMEDHPWRWSSDPVDVQALPRLINRHDTCFPSAKKPRPIPMAQPARPSKGYGRGVGGLGTAGGKSSAQSKKSRSKSKGASPSRSRKAESGVADMLAAPSASAPVQAAEKSRRIAGDADDEAGPAKIATATATEGEAPMRYNDWGAKIYLSNDDTMSLSSAQRVLYAIDNFLPLPAEHIRPHELLNYFSFDTAPVPENRDFSVAADITENPDEPGLFSLGLAVSGRPVDKGNRRNANLTFVIDRSGSMRDEGRMNYLQQGLSRMVSELKHGDMVHLVLFDHDVCSPLENFVIGRDNPKMLERAIGALKPRGSTDIHRGLSRGYEIADRSYLQSHSNRVVLITDALANTGVTNEEMIAMISKYYDSRRIRLSGVGVGRNFNDSLLDRLTERGRGAYVFLGSPAEVDAVFGARFVSLIETTAADVHFRLHLPPSLRMNVFYGEESSTVKADVQAIHYFAGTSQLFLSDVMAKDGRLAAQDDVMLTVEYKDPETEAASFEEYSFNLGAMQSTARNVRKGRLIMTWIDMLAEMAARPQMGHRYAGRAGAVADEQAYYGCESGTRRLNQLQQGLESDSEVTRVLDLWSKYCARYERPRKPVKRRPIAQPDAWPGAQSTPR